MDFIIYRNTNALFIFQFLYYNDYLDGLIKFVFITSIGLIVSYPIISLRLLSLINLHFINKNEGLITRVADDFIKYISTFSIINIILNLTNSLIGHQQLEISIYRIINLYLIIWIPIYLIVFLFANRKTMNEMKDVLRKLIDEKYEIQEGSMSNFKSS